MVYSPGKAAPRKSGVNTGLVIRLLLQVANPAGWKLTVLINVTFLFLLEFYFSLSLNAFAITETELKLIAAAAIMGLSKIPKKGNNIPAATGTPTEL